MEGAFYSNDPCLIPTEVGIKFFCKIVVEQNKIKQNRRPGLAFNKNFFLSFDNNFSCFVFFN